MENNTIYRSNWECKTMYKVYYCKKDGIKEALFDTKEEATDFAEMVNGHLNKYKWGVALEPSV